MTTSEELTRELQETLAKFSKNWRSNDPDGDEWEQEFAADLISTVLKDRVVFIDPDQTIPLPDIDKPESDYDFGWLAGYTNPKQGFKKTIYIKGE
jgi:hypothetical protein